jgi:putative flippase GtrA
MAEEDIVVAPESETAPGVEVLGSETTREFMRYFVASALALAADAISLYLLTSVVGVPYLVSGAIAFLFGLSIVYLLSVRWVFERRSLQSPVTEFALFATIGIVGLGLNELVLWLLTGVAGFHYLLSKFGSVVIVFSWNFGARKYFLFRSRSHA